MTDDQEINPYQSPVDSSGESTTSLEGSSSWIWLFFSFHGRVGRAGYWLGLILLIVTSAISFAAITAAFQLDPFSAEPGTRTARNSWIYIGLFAPFLWSWYAITVKRWHDRGKGAAWILISVVPYIGGAWAFVECGLMAGTRGPNRFGKRTLAPWVD